MNILVIGGMHGNEPLGLELLKRLKSQPIQSVSGLAANEKAIAINQRFIKTDLNRSFPGKLNTTDYEQKRAAQILGECKKFDLVLDFHNTHCPDNNCGFVGEKASNSLLNISSWLGLKKVVLADYECINKYALNCLSVEVSLSSSLMDVDLWYKKILALSKLSVVGSQANIQKYRFVYRMTLEDKDRLQLDKKNLKAFKPLEKKLAEKMNVRSPAYPIFINDAYTPYNYGGVLNKIKV